MVRVIRTIIRLFRTGTQCSGHLVMQGVWYIDYAYVHTVYYLHMHKTGRRGIARRPEEDGHAFSMIM